MDISVVIPLYNEAESLPELTQWIERVMRAGGYTYEIIFVNDGSTDSSWDVIRSCSNQIPAYTAYLSHATTAKARLSTPDSEKRRETWSLQWMPTCRIPLTKSPVCTA